MNTEQQQIFDKVNSTLKPYIEAWRDSLSFSEGLDGRGLAWSKHGLGFNAGIMGGGEGDGVKFGRKIDATLFLVAREASGLRYGEIALAIRANSTRYSDTGMNVPVPGGSFRALDLLAVRSIENFVSLVGKMLPSGAELNAIPVGAQLKYKVRDVENRLEAQDVVARDKAVDILSGTGTSLPEFRSLLKKADATIAKLLDEFNSVPGGQRMMNAYARDKIAETKGLPTQTLLPDGNGGFNAVNDAGEPVMNFPRILKHK